MDEREVWKKMYLVVAAAAADAADMMEPTPQGIRAGTRLGEALQRAEEIYLSAGEADGDRT